MPRRRDSGATVLAVDDWSTRWRCGCGYGNAGRERCLMCGAKAPEEVQGTPGLEADAEAAPAEVDPEAAVGRAGGKAGRTVAAVILLNLGIQAAEVAVFITTRTPPALAIRISLLTGLFFYGFTTLWVLARSAELGLRPRIGGRKGLVGAAEGFVVGGALAVLLVAVMRIVVGHPVLDPTSSLIASSSLGPLVLGIVLVVLAAPVVEELVFRGFLAEALRGRGKKAAVLLSAVAFSLAHLRLSQFRYYVIMGAVLGLVYWRRGLIGSVAAHATFNGTLVLVAVAASHGPAVPTAAAGSSVAIPATYRASMAPFGDDLVAVGPLGARVEFAHAELIGLPDAPLLARRLSTGGVPFPSGILVDYDTVTVLDLPVGQAVSAAADVDGQEGRLVLVPTPERLWVAVFRSDGSARSHQEFDAMLGSWRLPPV